MRNYWFFFCRSDTRQHKFPACPAVRQLSAAACDFCLALESWGSTIGLACTWCQGAVALRRIPGYPGTAIDLWRLRAAVRGRALALTHASVAGSFKNLPPAVVSASRTVWARSLTATRALRVGGAGVEGARVQPGPARRGPFTAERRCAWPPGGAHGCAASSRPSAASSSSCRMD